MLEDGAYSEAELLAFRAKRINRICDFYKCDRESAVRFLDFREEGYSVEQAGLMAGLTDPPE